MNNHSARAKGQVQRQPARRGGQEEGRDAAAPRASASASSRRRSRSSPPKGFYNAKVSQIAHAGRRRRRHHLPLLQVQGRSADQPVRRSHGARQRQPARGASTPSRRAVGAPASASCKLHLELVEQNRDMAEVISVELRQSSKFIREYSNPKFAEFLRTIAGAVVEGQRTGELRADIDPYVFARALFGALDEIALAWLVKHPGSKASIELPRAAEQLGRPVHRRASRPLNEGVTTVKILVTAKRVPDPEQKVKLKGNELDQSAANWQLNQFDEYAVETALRLTENASAGNARDGEVIGRVDRPQGRAAAAALDAGDGRRQGRPRRRRTTTSSTPRSSRARSRSWSSATSRTSSSWASWPPTPRPTTSGSASPATSAGRRRPSPATIEVVDGGKALLVGREVDAGVEIKKVTLPAVVTVDLRIVAPHADQERQDGQRPRLRRRAALRVAQGHHGGQEEADRGDDAGSRSASRAQQTREGDRRSRRRRRARPASRWPRSKSWSQKLHNEAKVI